MANVVRKTIHQYSLVVLVVSLSLSRDTGAYYSGHNYHQHQQQPRHLSSHRHQVSHRSSQYLPSPSSSLVRAPSPSAKYPNLDRLLHRLDAEGGGKTSSPASTTDSPPNTTSRKDYLPTFLRPTVPPVLPATPMPFTTPSPPHRHRHQQQHQEDFYDDDLDEEEEEDDEDDHPQHNGNRDSKVAWDVKFSEDPNYQRQQAVGGGGSLSLSGLGTATSFSERKWQVMGNRQSLDEYRRRKWGSQRQMPTEAEIREAVQHALKVSREGSCKIPRPKVVQVKDIYPHPSKTYIPHCTILHQCGDDTGCCRHETLSCVPRTTHRVELHFYTTTLGSQHHTVEKLVFYNHTECECQDKMEELMPRDTGKTSDVATRQFRHSSNGARIDSFGPLTFKSYRPDRTAEQPPSRRCRCPSLYSVRYPNDGGSCTCDCFDKQRECIRAKRGKEYFSLEDRLCIQSEECQPPTCEFGIYLRRAGCCPRKREKFAAWQRYSLDEYK